MKYSVKHTGKVNYQARATDNCVSIFKGLIEKIASGFKGNKEPSVADKVGKPESGFTAGGNFEWEVEASAEISVEELGEIYKFTRENDIHAWDMLKTAGNDIIKGSRSLLDAFKEQGPEWLDAIHAMDLKYEDNEKERELHKFRNEREADAEVKKAGWTRKCSFWYENEAEGRKTSVHFNGFKKDKKKDEPHKGSFDNFKEEE